MTIGSSMSFDPAHSRLRKKAVSKLKQNTAEQLEQETKKMEGRIRALKEQMVKEKEEREKYGGTRWTSSNKGGPLQSNPQQPTKKKTIKAEKGPRRIKILSDEPLATYAKKNLIKESLSESFGSDKRCGQCDKAKATLACVECTENYCVGCFMSFHRKGALRNHKTRNFDEVNNSFTEEKQRISHSATNRAKELSARRAQNGVTPEPKIGGALLQGIYDEKESSASFAQALKEWRGGKGKENNWVNPTPTGDVKVSSVSCETSTKPAEINLNFGSNKHMSYLDRLLLKKHREGWQTQPVARTTSRGKQRKSAQKENQPFVDKSNDDFGINYREIFQNIGVHSARQRSSSSQNYRERTSIAIEEVLDNTTNDEETTSCIIDEHHGENRSAPTSFKTTGGSGRMSILGMTADGDFREDVDEVLVPSAYNATIGRSLHSSLAARSFSRLVAQRGVSPSVVSRVWTPQPTYTGLSDFFLSGVKPPSPRSSPKRDLLDRTPKCVTPGLLAKGLWKPDESVYITDVTAEEQCDRESSIAGFPVIPLVQEPSYNTGSDTLKEGSGFMEKGNSIEDDVQNMQDFGIVDFLKAGPVPRKLSGDYNNVHRVSTVSPLTLTPNPPKFHWSDDDSDDDAIVDGATNVIEERISRCEDRLEQDNNDRVTLEDLTWELASTTGRQTQCGEDLGDSLEGNHAVGRTGDSCDEDSIEENNGGLSLGDDSSDDVDDDGFRSDESLMKDEVHALK